MDRLEEIRAVIDEFPDRALAGEAQGKIGPIGHFYGNDRPRLHAGAWHRGYITQQ
jgi:alpha-glucosidase